VAYEVVIKDNKIYVHYDLCDKLIDLKDDLEYVNSAEFVNLINFAEVEEFLNKDEYKDFEIIYCEECTPKEKQEEYDEEYDDFYEEFDDEEEIDNSRCDL